MEVPLGVVFYLWVGIFNLMVIAQFWSFANDLYTPEQGKRLFPIVAFGASLGAVLGSYVAQLLIGPLGVYQLMLVAGGLLVLNFFVRAGDLLSAGLVFAGVNWLSFGVGHFALVNLGLALAVGRENQRRTAEAG
ncbi:MAG: hypothetical protein HYW07_15715 [Candidatus Latescibacteria bacterium]|nr:hypothetical protein [Candidatus Latescibacterota bacterium]